MALTLSSTIKDKIAYRLFSQSYSGLSSDYRASLVDGEGASALLQVEQYAQWWAQAGATAAPDAWESLLVDEACYRIALNAHPERATELRRMADRSRASLFENFSLDAATLASLAGQNVHAQGIRFYVMDRCLRLKPRVFVSPAIVDAETQWVLNFAWHQSGWNIRRRQVRMTIHRIAFEGATFTHDTRTITKTGAFAGYKHVDGARVRITSGTGAILGDYIAASKTSDNAITLTTTLCEDADGQTDIAGVLTWVTFAGLGSNETFDSIASAEWVYDDTQSRGVRLAWADADDMARAKARHDDEARPEVFRTENRASYQVWHFGPEPDDEYTARGEVFIAGPGTPANATDTAVFEKFPAPLRPLLRDLVLGRVLKRTGMGDAVWNDAMAEANRLFDTEMDPGSPNERPMPGDVYRDLEHMAGDGWNMLGGQM